LFEFTEVLRKHLLRGLWDRPLEIGKSHRLVPGEMCKDRHLPTPVDTAERVSQTIGTNHAIMYVLVDCIRHSYLLVATPLNSAFLHLFSARFTISATMKLVYTLKQLQDGCKTSSLALLLCVLTGPGALAQGEKSGFIKTSDGIRIHYVEAGKGDPIVFIPGWRMPGWIWQKQIDGLSDEYRVIAVDPRSQGESDKPDYGHLPENRARDYKQVVDQLGLKQPVLIGWSMGCGELLSYVEQFGEDGIKGLVLVDGLIPASQNPEIVSMMYDWLIQLQQDRQKEAQVFVRSMYKKPEPEEYLQRVIRASMKVPTDTTVTLLHNMVEDTDFSNAFARINRPVLFVYEPALQPNADFLKAKLGDRVRLERFDGAGHALFVDDPEKFNRVVADFVQSLSR
jgi:non-heme chloroperoxidase